MTRMTRLRLILSALRVRLKTEGPEMSPVDYARTQQLIDEYHSRLQASLNPHKEH